MHSHIIILSSQSELLYIFLLSQKVWEQTATGTYEDERTVLYKTKLFCFFSNTVPWSSV